MTKKIYGLLGKKISYSFSKKFFTKKFTTQNLDCEYLNFDLQTIDELPETLDRNITNLKGFNITIPYKEEIFQYLDEIDPIAQEINAVNCVKLIDNFYLKGYNTDAYGFKKSIKPFLKEHHKKALILGTGGASKAVAYALKKLNIDILFVSRNSTDKQISYLDLDEEIIKNHNLIINTTPLGTKGELEKTYPDIPYKFITKKHLLFDLIYNPKKTKFLKKGLKKALQLKTD